MTEAEMKQVLLESSQSLLSGNTNKKLLDVLLSEFGKIEQAFILNWIPEQGEDIYTVAVPPRTVATIEIPRDENELTTPPIQKVSFTKYQRTNLTKEIRRKLVVLQKLLR